MVTAFTGKVVSELTRRVHAARTMHSLLYVQVLHDQERRRADAAMAALAARAAGSPELARIVEARAELYRLLGPSEHPSPFEGVRVLVVDEASLMPFSMLEQLLTAAHSQRRDGQYLAHLILCGDPDQLPPIA